MRLPKPEGCRGCPWWQDGFGFVPDEIKPGSKVTLVLQNPGEHEENGERIVRKEAWGNVIEAHPHAPALGDTGLQLSRLLSYAGLTRDDVSLVNPLRCRWAGENDIPANEAARLAMAHCQRAHFRPAPSTQVYVALGQHALNAVVPDNQTPIKEHGEWQKQGISTWRGWALPLGNVHPLTLFTPTGGKPFVYATYHPAFLLRAPWEWPTAKADWRKLGQILAGLWPRPMPRIYEGPPAHLPHTFGFDTEFWWEGNRMYRWSLFGGGERVYVVEHRPGDRFLGTWGWGVYHRSYSHNWVADMRFYLELGLPEPSWEDTMYMHHVLYSDLEHTLDYVGSIYQSFNRHKHLSESDPIAYAGGDAVSCYEGGETMQVELAKDPGSNNIYRHSMLPVLPVLARYEYGPGLRLIPERVRKSVEFLEGVKAQAQDLAEAVAGYPLKLSSPQKLAIQLFDVDGLR